MIQQKVRKKKRPVLMVIFSSQSKIMGLNKMWSLKNLAMLKCESGTTLNVVQYKPCSVLLFCSYSKNG